MTEIQALRECIAADRLLYYVGLTILAIEVVLSVGVMVLSLRVRRRARETLA